MRRLVTLTENRTLVAGYSYAYRRSKEWIVFLPESGAGFQTGSRAELKMLIGQSMAAKFNFLAVNKPGISPKGKNLHEFEASFRRDYRVSDALQTMKTIIPAGTKFAWSATPKALI